MGYREILYNSVTVNLPKNIIQFFLGVVLYWLVFGSFNPFTVVLALAAFLLVYSSVYLFNDIIDHKDDRKDESKRAWKPIASGRLSVESAVSLFLLLIVSGFVLSVFVNIWFTMVMAALVLLNFLHSSTFFRLKKSLPKTLVNMTAIQFLKYSSGWFALTSNISMFPLFLMLTLSTVYTTAYVFYKLGLRGSGIMENRLPFGVMIFFSSLFYIASVIFYDFSLALVFMFLMASAVAVIAKYSRIRLSNIRVSFVVEYLLMPMIIISFLLLANPALSETNRYLTVSVHDYSERAAESMPAGIRESFEGLLSELEKYEYIEDIQFRINLSASGASFD